MRGFLTGKTMLLGRCRRRERQFFTFGFVRGDVCRGGASRGATCSSKERNGRHHLKQIDRADFIEAQVSAAV